MTNLQIITTELKLNGIDESVDTYAGWKRRGYQVKKGSKALFKTTIWRPVKAKNDGTEGASAEIDYDKMIMVQAAFFGLSQVEKIK